MGVGRGYAGGQPCRETSDISQFTRLGHHDLLSNMTQYATDKQTDYIQMLMIHLKYFMIQKTQTT